MGFHLRKKLTHIPLFPALNRGIEADSGTVRPGFDDLIQTIKGAAADKENIGRIHRNGLLLRMLSATLGRYGRNSPLQNLQQSLLNTFSGYIPGDGSILALSGDLIHLINVNNTPLGTLHIKVSCLQQAKKNVLYIIAHITRFRKCGSIGNGKRNVQNLCQSLRKQSFAAAGRTNQQNIALLKLHIRVTAKEDTLIVIVYRYGQRYFGLFLANDIVVHEGFHLHGGGQSFRTGSSALLHFNFIPQ